MAEITWMDVAAWAQEHIQGHHCVKPVQGGLAFCTTYEHIAARVNDLLDDERRACALVAIDGKWADPSEHGTIEGQIARAIRARGQARP